MKVLITGITGFLGSKIAEKLLSENFEIIGLKRPGSDTWRCRDFINKICWIEVDERMRKSLSYEKPDLIIHCAWMGVNSENRNNWTEQTKNINFLVELLETAAEISVKKMIFLGSQAEYGRTIEKVDEEKATSALDAYSCVKLATLEITKAFCSINKINWVWLRVFSVFGEKEDSNWLIPSLVNKMKISTEMDFTLGGQKYAYLYISDFAEIIHKIVGVEIPSGVYNLSNNVSRSIKNIVESIRNIVNPSFKLNFGAILYRQSQSMHVQGNIIKLSNIIGEINFTDFDLALHNTINYYLTK